jgi:hypothetical protein
LANTKVAYRFFSNDRVGKADILAGHFQSTRDRLAVTIAGVPLGLAAVKFWTRKKFKGTAALKKKINPTRIPIEKKESIRWLENLNPRNLWMIQDDASISVIARATSTSFSARHRRLEPTFWSGACVDRLAGDGDHDHRRDG